jgi:hypothetical protein
MPRLIAGVGGLIFTLALVSQAEAQSGHVNQSGQSPKDVKQMPGGVYLIQTPGQSRANIKMMPGNRWVVETRNVPFAVEIGRQASIASGH